MSGLVVSLVVSPDSRRLFGVSDLDLTQCAPHAGRNVVCLAVFLPRSWSDFSLTFDVSVRAPRASSVTLRLFGFPRLHSGSPLL